MGIRYLSLQREQAFRSVTMTAELVMPVVGQGYRAIFFSMCSVCYYHHSIIHIHAVKEVHGRVGADFKPCPK